jgi:hypothetical protein
MMIEALADRDDTQPAAARQDPSTPDAPEAVTRWLRYTIDRYERWTARLAQ